MSESTTTTNVRSIPNTSRKTTSTSSNSGGFYDERINREPLLRYTTLQAFALAGLPPPPPPPPKPREIGANDVIAVAVAAGAADPGGGGGGPA